MDKTSVTVQCRTKILNERRNSLSIELFDHQHKICNHFLGNVRIHSPKELPPTWNQFFFVYQATDFVLRPKITTTDESLRSYRPEDRNCFFENEKELKYFTTYTQGNCMHECYSNFTFKICQCVDFNHASKFDLRLTIFRLDCGLNFFLQEAPIREFVLCLIMNALQEHLSFCLIEKARNIKYAIVCQVATSSITVTMNSHMPELKIVRERITELQRFPSPTTSLWLTNATKVTGELTCCRISAACLDYF